MLFVGFCGRFLRRTPDLGKHDLNEYAVDLRRSLGANRVRRDLPSLVAGEPGRFHAVKISTCLPCCLKQNGQNRTDSIPLRSTKSRNLDPASRQYLGGSVARLGPATRPPAPRQPERFFSPSRRLKVIMKIAQVAPLIESVPPRLYGGSERVVSYLTEELVRLGHDVTLFASGDSITSAELAPCCTRALRLDPTVRDIIPYFMLMIDKVRERAEEFDVLHFHIDLFHFPLFRSLAARTLTTLHGRQDLGDLKPFYGRFGEMPLVSISNDQRKPLPHANFVATIHHGVPAGLHRPSFEQGKLEPEGSSGSLSIYVASHLRSCSFFATQPRCPLL
jgi:hypothetical protein